MHAGLVQNSMAWHILLKDAKYGRLFVKNKKTQFIYRKGKNIGNHLVHSDIA